MEKLIGHQTALGLGVNKLRRGTELLKSDTFKILIVGQFNCGKSTFVNALLGNELLPAFPYETTAVICEIKWGPKPSALLYLKPQDGKPGKPVRIPHQNLAEYVTIDAVENMKKAGSMPAGTHAMLELLVPLELCKNGVELIDSPGLNGSEAMEKLTQDYAQQADEIIYLLSADRALDRFDHSIIERFRTNSGYDEIIFIVNKFDILRPRDRDEFVRRYRERIEPLTSRGRDGLYFLSARDALEGELEGNRQKIASSGMEELERYLGRSLFDNTGQVRLQKAVHQCSHTIAECRRTITDQRNLLQAKEEDLKKLVNEKEFYNLQQERIQEIKKKVNRHIEKLKREAKERSRIWFERKGEEFINNELFDEYSNFEESFKQQVKRGSGAEALKNLQLDLHGKVRQDFRDWAQEENGLNAYLTAETEKFVKRLQEDSTIRKFAEDVSGLIVRATNPDLASKFVVAPESLTSYKEIKRSRREVEMVLASKNSSMLDRGWAKVKKAFKDIGVYFTASQAIEETIKEFGKMLKKQSDKIAELVADDVAEELNTHLAPMYEDLEDELNRIRHQIEQVAKMLEAKKLTPENLAKETRSLRLIEEDLILIEKEVKNIDARIAPSVVV
jgi:GTPase SAR1 family protein